MTHGTIKNIFGRFLQFLILFVGVIFVVYTRDSFFIVISFFVFLFFGAIFEQILISRSKCFMYKKLKISTVIQSFIYVHFMVSFFASYKERIYDFSDRDGFIRNLLVYFIMTLYLIVASLLFVQIGYYGLLVYLIPAITNIVSFWRHDYQII